MSKSGEPLTAEDLRSRLYSSLRDQGLVDNIKSQLRNRLISELKQKGLSHKFEPEPAYSTEGSLLHRAANSLIADHLRRSQYDYSLSVFLPESGTGEDKIFTMRDLLQLLNISPHSNLYSKMMSKVVTGSNKKGFLWQLLCEIAAEHGNASNAVGVQTEQEGLPPMSSLMEKFRQVDDYYTSISDDSKARVAAVEERILTYQRALDERSRTELRLEMARFRENELSRMRLEEREKNRQDLEHTRREMERSYKTKYDALLERERNTNERFQKLQEMTEKDTFAQRQTILDEIESVRVREASIRRTEEINIREKQLKEDQLKTREENLRRREDNVKKSEIELESKLQDQIQKYKLEEQARYLQRFKDLELREIKAMEDGRRLEEDLRDIKSIKDELRDKKKLINELEADLQRTRRELLSSQSRAEGLGEKVRGMVDYERLKDENLILKTELDDLKGRLATTDNDLRTERQKHENLLHELSEKASRPTPELLLLQHELQKTKGRLKQEQFVVDQLKHVADTRVQDEADRRRHLMQQYNEQSFRHKDMHQAVTDLREQLYDTRTALVNEVYNSPGRGSKAYKGFLSGYSHKLPPPSYYNLNSQALSVQDPLPSKTQPLGLSSQQRAHDLDYSAIPYNMSRSPSVCDLELDDDPNSAPLESTHQDLPPSLVDDLSSAQVCKSDDTSYASDIVMETKKRLKSLEREAEDLEANYKNFQFRLTSVTAAIPDDLPRTPPRSLRLTQHRSTSHHVTSRLPSSHVMPTSSPHRVVVTSPVRLSPEHSRPLSSTPYKGSVASHRDLHTPPPIATQVAQLVAEEKRDINLSMSSVKSSPLQQSLVEEPTDSWASIHEVDNKSSVPTKPPAKEKTVLSGNRPMQMSDLEARSGSPSLMVLEGSATSSQPKYTSDLPLHVTTDIVQDGGSALQKRISPTGQEKSEKEASAPKLAPLVTPALPPVSLDSAWKTQTAKAKSRQEEEEEEERRFEEERLRREEERRKRDEERWEREQRDLAALEVNKNPSNTQVVAQTESKPSEPDDKIDPVMQKYMAMVAKQKEQEKEAAVKEPEPEKPTERKTVDTWNTVAKVKTESLSGGIPSFSEHDVDNGNTLSDKSAVGGIGSDDDFEW